MIEFRSTQVKAVHTPGHTSEMTSYLVDCGAVITGDSLFLDSIGKTELEFSADEAERGASLQYESLTKRLLGLPDTVKVLPGHFTISEEDGQDRHFAGTPLYSTIGKLRKNNRALQFDKEDFIDYMFNNLPSKPPNYDHIIEINLGARKSVDRETAIELELGPNRCATSQESMLDEGG